MSMPKKASNQLRNYMARQSQEQFHNGTKTFPVANENEENVFEADNEETYLIKEPQEVIEKTIEELEAIVEFLKSYIGEN